MNGRTALERLRELLALRATEGLDAGERAELRESLRALRAQRDAGLSQALLVAAEGDDLALDLDPEGEAAAAAALHLALLGPLPARLPAALRRDLEWSAQAWLAGLAQESAPQPRPATVRAPAPRVAPRTPARSPARTVPRVLLAAALLLLVLGAAWWLRPAGAPPGPDARRAELLARAGTLRVDWTSTADPLAQGVVGDVVWSPAEQEGYMRLVGLAPNDARLNQYQLWIFDARRPEATPLDGGVFDVGPGEEVVVPIRTQLEVFEPTLFAITLEAPGGVVVSSRERLLLAASVPR